MQVADKLRYRQTPRRRSDIFPCQGQRKAGQRRQTAYVFWHGVQISAYRTSVHSAQGLIDRSQRNERLHQCSVPTLPLPCFLFRIQYIGATRDAVIWLRARSASTGQGGYRHYRLDLRRFAESRLRQGAHLEAVTRNYIPSSRNIIPGTLRLPESKSPTSLRGVRPVVLSIEIHDKERDIVHGAVGHPLENAFVSLASISGVVLPCRHLLL